MHVLTKTRYRIGYRRFMENFIQFFQLDVTAGRWMFILLALFEDLAWCRTSCAWYVVLWREVVIGWFANTTRWMAKLHTTIFRRLPGCQCRCLDFASFDVISHPCGTIWYLRWVLVGWMMDCYQKKRICGLSMRLQGTQNPPLFPTQALLMVVGTCWILRSLLRIVSQE